MNGVGSLVCVIVALCSDHDWEQWQLGWDINLLATLYSVKQSTTPKCV